MFWFNRKKKRDDEFPFDEDEFFEEFEREFKRMAKIMQKVFEDMDKMPKGQPIVKGIRITIGPDGVPRVEEFGNVRGVPGRKARITEYREPLTDIMESGDKIIVTVELPGVDKKDIKVKVDGKRLTIVAEGEGPFKYRKEVELPYRVNSEEARASFKNGILEIQLKKETEETEGKEIKIE